MLFAPLKYLNNSAAQVLEAPNGERKFLEELIIRDLNGSHDFIDHAIVGAQTPEGHGESRSRVQTLGFRRADFLLVLEMGEVHVPGEGYKLHL